MTQPATGSDRQTALERFEAATAAQPEAISQAITANFEGIRATAVLLAGARRVRLAGVGVSAFTAQVAEQILRAIGIDARATHAFDLAAYPTSFDPGDLLVVFAHRGTNAYTARVLQRAIHSGLKTVVVSDEPDGMRGAEARIDTTAGQADAPAAPFTAALSVVAAAAARCEPQSRLAAAVASLPELTRQTLSSRETAREVAAVAAEPARRTLIAGAGGNASASRAGAFWVKALAGLVCEGIHLEDTLHGGLLAQTPDDVLVQIAPSGNADDRHADVAVVANAIGFPRWKLGGEPDGARWWTPLPPTVEALTPLLAAIPLQWLALEAAFAAGDTGWRSRHADALAAIGL